MLLWDISVNCNLAYGVCWICTSCVRLLLLHFRLSKDVKASRKPKQHYVITETITKKEFECECNLIRNESNHNFCFNLEFTGCSNPTKICHRISLPIDYSLQIN